jgi:hypothetical protein
LLFSKEEDIHMNKKIKFIIESVVINTVKLVIGLLPFSEFISLIFNVFKDYVEKEKSEKERNERIAELKKILNSMTKRLNSLLEFSPDLDFEFNRKLDNDEYEKFSSRFCNDTDIPFESADMKYNYSGISIECPDSLTYDEVMKATRTMNNILQGVLDDLGDSNGDLYVASVNGYDLNE